MAAPLYISGEEVCRLVSTAELVEAVKTALQSFSSGHVMQPVRSAVEVKEHDGVLLTMPAFSQRSGGLGAKLVTLYAGNASRGLPAVQAIVLVFNAATGALQALIDGVTVTNLRTAAASVCAVSALVPRPPATVCIVGTGVQARSHAAAFRDTFPSHQLRVWGRSPDKTARCVADIGGGAVGFGSLAEAVSDADVIVTVTMTTEPLVLGKWLKPGAVICSVGACRPDQRELDDEVMHNALVVVDSEAAALAESGDIILSKAAIFAEIGRLLSSECALPSLSEAGKKFIVFKSLGMAVEDVASAQLIYQRYLLRNDTT